MEEERQSKVLCRGEVMTNGQSKNPKSIQGGIPGWGQGWDKKITAWVALKPVPRPPKKTTA